MSKLLPIGSALLLGLLGAASPAQIKSFTLEELVTTADNAVYGTIVATRAFRVDHPLDGSELFFTRLTIEGRSLRDGTPLTVDVTFHGGFVSETEGVFNSEAPAADDVRLGNRVVAFYRWQENLGGALAANALVAAHGGLYRTVDGPRGAAVLGRGAGYAVGGNLRLAQLESSLVTLYAQKKVGR